MFTIKKKMFFVFFLVIKFFFYFYYTIELYEIDQEPKEIFY